MTEDIAFSDWSKRLEHSSSNNDLNDENSTEQGTNSWLPAYGFYQPSATLQQTLLQNKNDEFYSNDMVDDSGPPPFFLQTIVEETSDDLRSETSESEYNSGLLTGSVSTVIHVPSYEDNSHFKNSRKSIWSGRRSGEINRDPGVQEDEDDDDEEEDDFTDDDDDDEEEEEEEQLTDTQDEDSDEESAHNGHDETFPARTSSLLQFENLEKHYENVFRPRHSSTSSGFDSSFNIKNRLWSLKSNSQPENINSLHDIDDDNDSSSLSSSCSSSSSELISSDELMSSYSCTKFGSLSQPRLSLLSFRSVDSLTSLLQKQEKEHSSFATNELSQSLNENISKLTDPKDEVDTTPAQDMYKTMECLNDITKDTYKNNAVDISRPENDVMTEKMKTGKSVENLSEDSGFGDHITKEPPKVINVKVKDDVDTKSFKLPVAESIVKPEEPVVSRWNQAVPEDCQEMEFIKPSVVGWQSHEGLSNETTYVIENEDLYADGSGRDGNTSNTMLSHLSVASTPNLYTNEEHPFKMIDMVNSTFNESQNCNSVSLSGICSPKLIGFGSATMLNGGGAASRGSNVQIMTSFVSVTKPVDKCNKEVQTNGSKSWAFELENVNGDDDVDAGVTLFNSCNTPFEMKGKTEYSPENNANGKLSKSSSWIYCNEDEEDIADQFQSKQLETVTSSPIRKSLPVIVGGGDDGDDDNASQLATKSNTGLATSQTLKTTLESKELVPSTDTKIDATIVTSSKEKSKSSVGKIGGFFQRFSLKRLSGRKHKNKLNSSPPPAAHNCVPKSTTENEDEGQSMTLSKVVFGKPPLPPVLSSHSYPFPLESQPTQKDLGNLNTSPVSVHGSSYNHLNARLSFLETDLDANSSLPCPPKSGNDDSISNTVVNKKSKSLLNLDNGRISVKKSVPEDNAESNSSHHACKDYRAKSMEFLLDKDNQASVKVPENELQKGSGERKMSEHELRVQRSLQKLNVPEWYKNSIVPSQGFILKRHNESGQNSQMYSKTTSLSSLCSKLSTPKSPTYPVTSSTPSQYSFSRWSTSKLNSGTNSSFTSPSGSARSSFNCKQPYLGWRSQEKLSKPKTPAERLAAGLLPPNSQNRNEPNHSLANLEDVQWSIKEVTSAIVHYVSGTTNSSDRSPSLKHCTDSTCRAMSLHGSTSRLYWLESSFVGGTRQSRANSRENEVKPSFSSKGLTIYKNPYDDETAEYIVT